MKRRQILDIKDTVGNRRDPWIIRRGTALVFLLFCFTMILSSFISYNEVVSGNVLITSKNPPAQVKVKRSGRISAIKFENGETVVQDDVLAILDNPADEDEVNFLKEKLKDPLQINISWESFNAQFSRRTSLGNVIQPSYETFLQAYQELLLEARYDENEIQKNHVEEQLVNLEKKVGSVQQEMEIARSVHTLGQKNLERHQILYSKGVISKYDMEVVQKATLEQRGKYEMLNQQLLELQSERSRVQRNGQFFTHSNLKKSSTREIKLYLAQQELLNKIDDWEEEFVIKSPISGKLNFNEIWSKSQNVEIGEVVFTVIPQDRQMLIGKCNVNLKNAGQIQVGQKVYLKLDNYPHREWGMIMAKVSSISQTPRNQSFLVYLDIDNLLTSYGKELVLNQDLLGTADILLDEVSILQRLFYQFRPAGSIIN